MIRTRRNSFASALDALSRQAPPAIALAAMLVAFLASSAVDAQIAANPNLCDAAGGAGDPCQTAADCAFKPYATACVEHTPGDITSRRCEIPCGAEGDPSSPDRASCAAGETCVRNSDRGAWFCQASRFRVDLNLVDQCVSFFLSGSAPALGSTNECSLEANLSRLLDQNGDGHFDIFDVDGCVRAFLDQPSCNSTMKACAARDLVYCEADGDCGDGLHCDTERNACVRECGVLASREPGIPSIERNCAGRLKTCNFERGRCEPAPIDDLTCAIDRDCPSGAYCFLGRCAPTCSRSLDCPDASWFCSDNGRCRVLPPPEAPSGFVFDPAKYALLSGTGGLTLDEVESTQIAPVHIMDLVTKREVKDNAAIAFGYRLEVAYGFKDDPICRRDPSSWSLEDKEECVLDPSREFVQPLEPFGTLIAKGTPGIPVALNRAAAERLSPGAYNSTVTVTFDNGNQLRFLVHYKKTTPSGEYGGSMTVYLERPENALDGGESLPIEMRLKVHRDRHITWDALLTQENLPAGRDIIDLTSGNLVTGTIHGNSSLPFAWPPARRPGDNEIPFKGIYSPQSGLMRLVTVVDLPADFCAGEKGHCDETNPEELRVRNPFGRDVRRIGQFFGTFDNASKRYFGLYRERISGLVPGQELTLDGSFQLTQTLFDDSDSAVGSPLLAVDASDATFPDSKTVLAAVDAEIAHFCQEDGDLFEEVEHFASPANFNRYLSNSFPALRDYTEFKSLLQNGLDALSSANRDDAVLTLHEFLSGRIVLCEDRPSLASGAPVTSTAPACVREQKLRCGLALYRKAILSSFVAGGDLASAGRGEHQLFCIDSMPTSGCHLDPAAYPTLRTLQEHNRFFNELSQSTKFLADRNLSDAFFALYRHRLNPFTQGAALNFKADRLREAYDLYEELLHLAVATPSASVLFRWPMSVFQGSGSEWLRQMQVLVRDRLDAQVQLVDLRRRVFESTGQSDQMLGDHLGHQEFLVQVYLAALQRQWEGADFSYSGDAPRAFSRIRTIQLQLNESKNPLGITPDRVFFETADPERTNWRNYLARLTEDAGGGLLGRARHEIDQAVTNLQNSLRDVDALENAIHASLRGNAERLDEICGPEVASIEEVCSALDGLVAEVKAGNLDPASLAATATTTCRAIWLGAPGDGRDACTEVATSFAATWDSKAECPVEATRYRVNVHGRERSCIGGRMGALLMEGDALRRGLKSHASKLQTLQTALEKFVSKRNKAEAIHLVMMLKNIIQEAVMFAIEIAKNINLTSSEALESVLEGTDCMVIGGVAVGTSCPQSLASAAGKMGSKIKRGVLDTLLMTAKNRAESIIATVQTEIAWQGERAVVLEEMEKIIYEVNAISLSWNGTYRQLIENEIEIQRVRLELRDIEERLNSDLSLVMDQLVGRETGSVLVGDYLVRRSATTFQKVLDATYRMVLAFSHRYDLPKAEEQGYIARVMQAITLEDVEELVDDISERARTYCSREAIDCDAYNNLSVLRVSLRDELFPDLRDVVDPTSGRVITRGEQFHNIITSPPFLRRRVRGVWTADQIEIPFTVGLFARDRSDGESWLINPTQCGHVLDGDPGGYLGERGTLAVNVVGRNLDGGSRGISYELARGHIDQVRSCRAEVIQEEVGTMPKLDYPLHVRFAGYAPESIEGQSSAPPTYVTRSSEFPACVNQSEHRGQIAGGDCWQFFARDRSLAAPDWTLTVPLRIGGGSTSNAWLAGEGLPEAARPVIEDLVVYLRYRSRPISEAGR